MEYDVIRVLQREHGIYLNEQQERAALHVSGPAVILAVPGAGKTTVLVTRTANLILNHGINPESILSLTFSKASSIDMQSRFNYLYGKEMNKEMRFSTIHSFSYCVLKEYSNLIKRNFMLIEGDNARISKNSLLRKIYFKLCNEYINDDKLEDLVSSISYVKNMMIDSSAISNNRLGIDGFTEIYRQYEKVKIENQLIDYDDMLSMCYEIFSKRKDILQRYRNRYKYIQVDEGQDTSRIQHEIIRLVSAPEHNIFLVGDEDQSIYGFRGAYPEAVLEFEEYYKGAKVFFMEENFRSTQNIVQTSNEFIKANIQRYNKNLFTINDRGLPITIKLFPNEYEEIKYIVERLKGVQNLSGEAVIFRNNISLIPIADALDKNGILFYVRDFKGMFFKHWVVTDIISFLTFSLYPDNMDAISKIYYKMDCYIPKKALNHAKNKTNGSNILNKVQSFTDLNDFQKNRIDILKQNMAALSRKAPRAAIDFIENNLKYRNYLERNSQRLGYSIESMMNVIGSLKLIAGSFGRIEDFLNRLEELQVILENAKSNNGSNAVTLSTVHGCKGLEFDNVTMLDLIEGQFPTQGSIDSLKAGDAREMEEERRLFYVGMTRARKRLTLISVNSKNNECVVCSRFVGEVYSILHPLENKNDEVIDKVQTH